MRFSVFTGIYAVLAVAWPLGEKMGLTLDQLNPVLSLFAVVALFLVKREITRVLTTVDRVPSQEWFESVKREITRMFEGYEELERRVERLEQDRRVGGGGGRH